MIECVMVQAQHVESFLRWMRQDIGGGWQDSVHKVWWVLQQIEQLREKHGGSESPDVLAEVLEGAFVLSLCARAHLREFAFWTHAADESPMCVSIRDTFSRLGFDSSVGASKMQEVCQRYQVGCEMLSPKTFSVRVQMTQGKKTFDSLLMELRQDFSVSQLITAAVDEAKASAGFESGRTSGVCACECARACACCFGVARSSSSVASSSFGVASSSSSVASPSSSSVLTVLTVNTALRAGPLSSTRAGVVNPRICQSQDCKATASIATIQRR